MNDQITLETALQLVNYVRDSAGKWRVGDVDGNILGSVQGDVEGHIGGYVGGVVRGDVGGSVRGTVGGNVCSDVRGNVGGSVRGTISGKKWTYIETPREKLARLIKESGNAELIKAFNEMEDSND